MITASEALSADHSAVLQALAEQTGLAMETAERMAELRETATRDRRNASRHLLTLTNYDRLSRVAATPHGHKAIAQFIHDFTGLAVVIEDRAGHVLAAAGSHVPGAGPPQPQSLRDEMFREALAANRPVRHGDRLIAPVTSAQEILGAVVLVDPARHARLVDKETVWHAAALLAVELVATRAVARPEEAIGREVVDDLLIGRDRADAVRRASLFGFPLDSVKRVVVVEADEHTPAEYFPLVRRYAKRLIVGSLLTVQSGAVVFLAGATGDWEDLRSNIATDLGSTCRIGVGGYCDDPTRLSVSYRQAQMALRLQKSATSTDRVMVFDDLGIYRVLAEVEHIATVEDFVEQMLGPLISYDRRKGSDLVRTLSVYLEHGGSHAGAAEALSVHRSTLRYRLDRIRQILERDFSDPGSRFNFQLATRAWTTLQALRDDGEHSRIP